MRDVLSSKRMNYFSNNKSISREKERDDLDREMDAARRSYSASIENLASLWESQEKDNFSYNSIQNRDFVLRSLRSQFSELVLVMEEFRKFRILERAKEDMKKRKLKEELARAASFITTPSSHSVVGSQSEVYDEAQSESEDPSLKYENDMVMAEIRSQFDDTKRLETSMEQISTITTEIATRLSEHSEQIGFIEDETEEALENIDKGNSELKKALRHSVSARIYMSIFMLLASAILLLLHWY
uniref:t-SNARE coiled-coil homology domain-containing protein n=1 Tax=Palpitomonas bilix TaxID=652834 RepID=A0A7S3DBF1_9EUKA|mmetsp:Transcript_29834/g.77012  ORF Transcript_29834/g.77012 Transcript_29834/m.77012 type:complete len:243 (+) Transcript_29834:270-998(+)